MIGEYKEIDCPFCNKGRVQCLNVIGSYAELFADGVKVNGKIKHPKRVSKPAAPSLEIHSDCPVCGMSKEDISNKLKTDSLI